MCSYILSKAGGCIQAILTASEITMTDSAELENATFCHLLGCDPADLYYKLYQNMAGTMSDAIDALQSNLLEEFSDEPLTCTEIRERCQEMQQVN